MDSFTNLLLTLWPHPSWALKDNEDRTDPQKMPRWSSVIEPILVSLESPITLIDPTSDHEGFNPNSFIDPTLDQSGDQPQLIHRSNTGSVRGSTPTPTVNPQAGLRQDQLQHLQPSQARQRENGPQRFGRRAPGRQGIKCRPKTEPSNVFICKMSVFAPTT